MKIWYHNDFEAQEYLAEVVGNRIHVGRDATNDIILNSPFVAGKAAVIDRVDDQWQVISLGLNGCEVGGERLKPGEQRSLEADDSLKIFPFTFRIDRSTNDDSNLPWHVELDRYMAEFIRLMHKELLDRMDLESENQERFESEEYLLTLERNLEEIARINGLLEDTQVKLLDHLAGYAVRGELIESLIIRADSEQIALAKRNTQWMRLVSAHPEREHDLKGLVAGMQNSMGVDPNGDLSEQMRRVEKGFWEEWQLINGQLYGESRTYLALRQLKKLIKDIVFGYGPLEDLLRAPNISEIMVVSSDRIYIERDGVVENSGRQFVSDEVTVTVIERIVSKVGRRIDKSQPLVDARLSDGSRVNAVIPPLAVSGPCLTIRKFPLRRLTVKDLMAKGSLTPVVSNFLKAAVHTHKNILIAGGTGTGKTTMLNCLTEFIPNKERIVTIEDTAELQVQKDHVVRMETKQANAEGTGAYTINDLVKNSLRMRPDRIVVGECRGPEALAMLQAMNTGHDGSMTTIHANNAQDVILRLEVLVQSAADLPIQSIHRQIASAIDVIVQLTRLPDGRRCVTQITEVVGMESDGNGIRTKDIFKLDVEEKGAELHPTGQLPTFMSELMESNLVELDAFFC